MKIKIQASHHGQAKAQGTRPLFGRRHKDWSKASTSMEWRCLKGASTMEQAARRSKELKRKTMHLKTATNMHEASWENGFEGVSGQSGESLALAVKHRQQIAWTEGSSFTW